MPEFPIPVPNALNEDAAANDLLPNEAAVLEWTDTQDIPGRAIRGRGYARSDDVGGTTDTVISCGIAIKRDCRKVLLAHDAGGNLVAHQMGTGGTVGRCSAVLPAWGDNVCPEGAQCTYVQATDDPNTTGGTDIFTGAEAGAFYEVTARGTWSTKASDPQHLSGPDGNTLASAITVGLFAGFVAYAQFWVIPPGGAWEYVGYNKIIKATTAGTIKGAFADQGGLYGDNGGYMFVTCRKVG